MSYKLGEHIMGCLMAIAGMAVAVFFAALGFFKLVLLTENAFFGTSFMNPLRALVLTGWVTVLFVIFCLYVGKKNDWFSEGRYE
jgi:hypothetical protein